MVKGSLLLKPFVSEGCVLVYVSPEVTIHLVGWLWC